MSSSPWSSPRSSGGTDGHLLTGNGGKADVSGEGKIAWRVLLNGNVARRRFRTSGVLWDTELAGFGLRHSRSGAKVWIVQHRYRGATRRAVLGKVSEMSATAARKAARLMLAEAALDGLPETARGRRRSKDIEFRAFAELFWKHYSLRWKPTTRQVSRSYIDVRLIPRFGDMSVRTIKRSDVLDWRDSMTQYPGAFNRAIPILSVMLSYAETLGYRKKGSNPCRGVPRFTRKPAERYLSAHEYQRLASTLRDMRASLPEATAAVWLLIYTGARKFEIAGLHWEWIGERHIDLPDSKTGPKRVYLNRQANAALDGLGRQARGPVFSEGFARSRLGYHWEQIRAKAALQDLRMHDLRHSFASVAIGHGISLTKLGGLLGHELPETTARYAHLADELVHEAAGRVSHSIARALGLSA